MYKITIQTLNGNEKTLYYPGNDEFTVLSASLSLKVGNAGELKFTVPQSNPLYNEIVDRSIITIYEDNTEIWRGDIQDISQNFDKSLEVYALEDLAWLGDETVPMVAVENQTYAQRFSTVMANYNDNQPAKRQFQPGIITSVTTSNFCNWQPLYEETLLECIRRCIADNGYLKVRRVTNNGTVTRYIDILLLEDYGQQAQQAIRFGSNLLDFVKEIDNTNFLNVLYPYGKETEEKLYGDVMRRIEGTPIQNDASIAAFGRHSRTVIFETDSMANLNRLALAYLNRYSQPSLKIKAKAIDLGNIEDISRMHLGDSVRIIAEPFAIDQWDYITNQELDLLNIANNQIELSDAVRVSTLTSQVASQGEEIKDTRTPASVLDEAKRNAWSIIEGDNGGIVTFDVNGNEQIIGIHIANNLNLDQATKAWGWNVNGLVYLHRTYPSDEWQIGIAMTMNGEIVADYITTGTMSADRVRTGNLESHNYSYSSGNFNIAGTIIDMDDGLIRTPGFKADGAGNVYIANGAVIGGYAKDSDIPDVSGFATKTGLAQEGYTIIDAGNITTGEMVANRIKGGTLTLGGGSNVNGEFEILDASNNVIVKGNKDGLITTQLKATGNCEFGSLQIGTKTIKPDGVERTVSYVYANGWKQLFWNEWPSLSKNFSKYIYFSPYYDGWTANADVNISFYVDDSGSHSSTEICRVTLYKWNGSSWATQGYRRYNSDLVEMDNKDDYFTGFTASDKSYYRLKVVVKKFTWASDYELDIYTDQQHVVELDPYETLGSFRGNFSGSAELYALSVGNTNFNFNGSITNDDEDTNASYSVSYGEFNSQKETDNYTRLSCNNEAVIAAYKSSSEYVRLKTSNPSIKVYDSSTEYIDISKSSMRLESSSSDFCIFRGDSNLAASDSGTSYYISWVQGSDRRIKEEIEPLDLELSRNLINATETKKFRYKSDKSGKHYGMIAQEARELLDSLGEEDAVLEYAPNVENEDIPNYRAIHYEEYIPHIINYVKDLRSEIVSLKEEVRILKEEKNDGKH